MKKSLSKKVIIPEGVSVEISENGRTIVAKGSQGEVKRSFKFKKILVEKKDNEVVISCKSATKREKRMISTISAHVINLLHGVNEKFVYDLKICASHFPMTVDYDAGKGVAIIKNFLGEKVSRKVSIPKGAEVSINKDLIEIKAVDKEVAGQAAANFEKATFVSLRDRRVFQDGIFITKKAGREM